MNALAAIRPQAQARFATVAANTRALQDKITAGRKSPDASDSAWGIGEQFYPRHQVSRKHLEGELGPLKATHVLGTLPYPEGRGAVIARLDFEKGSRFLRYLWGPGGRLMQFRELTHPAGIDLFPESPAVLFSYTPSSGSVRRVEVQRDAGGRVEGLVLQTPSGPLRAARKSPKAASESSPAEGRDRPQDPHGHPLPG